MALDPLSIAAACTGLLSSIARLSLDVRSFISRMQETAHDLAGVLKELSSLDLCLDTLSKDAMVASQRMPEPLKHRILLVLGNITEVFKDIQAALHSYSPTKLGSSIRWSSYGHEDMNKLRSRLESHKASLEITLALLNLSISTAIKDDTSVIKNNLQDNAVTLEQIAQALAELPQRIAAQLQRGVNGGPILSSSTIQDGMFSMPLSLISEGSIIESARTLENLFPPETSGNRRQVDQGTQPANSEKMKEGKEEERKKRATVAETGLTRDALRQHDTDNILNERDTQPENLQPLGTPNEGRQSYGSTQNSNEEKNKKKGVTRRRAHKKSPAHRRLSNARQYDTDDTLGEQDMEAENIFLRVPRNERGQVNASTQSPNGEKRASQASILIQGLLRQQRAETDRHRSPPRRKQTIRKRGNDGHNPPDSPVPLEPPSMRPSSVLSPEARKMIRETVARAAKQGKLGRFPPSADHENAEANHPEPQKGREVQEEANLNDVKNNGTVLAGSTGRDTDSTRPNGEFDRNNTEDEGPALIPRQDDGDQSAQPSADAKKMAQPLRISELWKTPTTPVTPELQPSAEESVRRAALRRRGPSFKDLRAQARQQTLAEALDQDILVV